MCVQESYPVSSCHGCVLCPPWLLLLKQQQHIIDALAVAAKAKVVRLLLLLGHGSEEVGDDFGISPKSVHRAGACLTHP